MMFLNKIATTGSAKIAAFTLATTYYFSSKFMRPLPWGGSLITISYPSGSGYCPCSKSAGCIYRSVLLNLIFIESILSQEMNSGFSKVMLKLNSSLPKYSKSHLNPFLSRYRSVPGISSSLTDEESLSIEVYSLRSVD